MTFWNICQSDTWFTHQYIKKQKKGKNDRSMFNPTYKSMKKGDTLNTISWWKVKPMMCGSKMHFNVTGPLNAEWLSIKTKRVSAKLPLPTKY